MYFKNSSKKQSIPYFYTGNISYYINNGYIRKKNTKHDDYFS